MRDSGLVTVNITEERSVEQAVERIVKTFGGLDFALNNAGVPSTGVQFADMTLGEWERAVR